MFCVLDVESTGGPFGKEAMMEIALFRYDGEEVTDQLISLIHPHREVQRYVSKMTGITDKMLARAPRFHELAKRIIEITDGAVLVGHNVDFDYRMLRQEFGRLGYQYERKTLDTIQLAEELIPGLQSYGLSRLGEELGLYHSDKHRAESDARATLELFKLLQEKDRRKEISIMGQSIQQADYQREKVNDLLRSVKSNRGLFYLHDAEGKLLFMGASDNIKSALSRIIISDTKRGEELREKVTSVKTELAGNWLIARIKKTEELRSARPPYNRDRELKLEYGVYLDKRDKLPKLYQLKLASAGKKKPLAKSPDSRMAARVLRMFGRSFSNPETREQVILLLKKFPQQALFRGRGRNPGERCVFIVKEAELAGYYYYKLEDQISHSERLEKNYSRIEPNEIYTEMLKLGILSGEFTAVP